MKIKLYKSVALCSLLALAGCTGHRTKRIKRYIE